MSEHQPTPYPSPEGNTVSARLGWQVAGMFAGAVLLGFIYNGASPLGVRATKPPGAVQTPPATAPASAKSTLPQMGYFNETLAMSLEEVGAHSTLAQPSNPAIKTMTWAQVKPLLDAGRIVVLDARSQANYEVDHIPGAVSLPSNSTPPELQAFAARYPKSMSFVIYCSSANCPNARQLAEVLINMGFTDVSEMPGGFVEFRAAKSQAHEVKP